MKVHKNPCHIVFGFNVAGRLVDNALYVKINLKRTIMYFRDFFLLILPLEISFTLSGIRFFLNHIFYLFTKYDIFKRSTTSLN